MHLVEAYRTDQRLCVTYRMEMMMTVTVSQPWGHHKAGRCTQHSGRTFTEYEAI